MIPTNTTLDMLKKSSNGKLLWTKKEVGSVLGVSESSVSNYMTLENNPLGFVKLGAGKKSAIRIPIESLAAFIDALSNEVHHEL